MARGKIGMKILESSEVKFMNLATYIFAAYLVTKIRSGLSITDLVKKRLHNYRLKNDLTVRVLPLYNTWKQNPALIVGMTAPVAGPQSEEFSHKLQNRTCNSNRETGPLQVR